MLLLPLTWVAPLEILFILKVTINVLACIIPAYFQYPPPPRKRKRRKIHFNVLLSIELFILYWTLWSIVGHIWREYELSLYLSFAYCYSSKIESFTLWISNCYWSMQQTPKSMLAFCHLHTRGRAWVKLGDVDACKMHTWTLHYITYITIIFASYKGYINVL